MTAVGEILELSYGKALKESDRDNGEVPVVGSGGVVGGHSTGITDAPTIVVGRKGSIGSVTWIDGPAWPIDTAYFVKPKRSDLDRRWTYWMLKSLRMETMNKSAAVPGLNRDDVYRLDVNLPPLLEQRRIAAILDRADAIRAKRRQVLARLDSLTQAIFRDAFGTILDGPRLDLEQLATVVTKGTTPTTVGLSFSDRGVPFLRAQNLQNGTVAFASDDLYITEDAHKTLKRSWIEPNDLLVSIAGTIGRVALVPPNSPSMNCNQAVAIVRLASPATGRWLLAWLNSYDAKAQIGASSVTATISNLSLGQIRKLKVPAVSADAIETFVSKSEAVSAQRELMEKRIAADDELFSAVQVRAFRGEL